MSNYVIAVDTGTQSVRAAVVGSDGNISGIAQVAHDVDSPHPGWAQQNPDSWWDNVCIAIRRVLDETPVSAGSVAAVATCGQMHGPVGIDKGGNVTTPWVQLWCDKRCAEQCKRLRREHDEAGLAEIAGSSANPAWTGLKVRWIKDNDRQAYDNSRWFLVPKDFINYRLTDVACADPSEASGSFLWDCRTDSYSPRLAEAVGVDLDKFAPIRKSHEVIGSVISGAARQSGLKEGTPVVAGGGDFPVSMLGFGIVGEGMTADVTGTSTLLACHSAKPLVHPAVQNLRHVVDGWIPFTILDCGGLSMKWCRDLVSSFCENESQYERLIEQAAQVPAGSAGLLFYPYMLGERRRENMFARGGFFGITLNHNGGHFIRAVMEGVALGMGKDLELFESLKLGVNEILCVGGGTKNMLWNQIKADVTQRSLLLSAEPEAGIKGAALLACAGVGLIEDAATEAVARRTTVQTVKPHAENADTYRAALEQFCRVYEHMLGFGWSA